jgi:hypothetical protein
MIRKVVLVIVCFSVVVSGCAFDLAHVKQVPSQFVPIESGAVSWRLVEDVDVRLGTGYRRQLKSGTRWDRVGKTEHGEVYKSYDQILTVEGSNIFEAYLVVSEGYLVGFYLPVERTYSPLRKRQQLQIASINVER